MDPLFPELPEDLKGLSDEEVKSLLDEHLAAAQAIDSDDEEFLKGLSADQIIEQYASGVEQIKTLRAENTEREQAYQNYLDEKRKIAAQLEEAPDEGDDSGDDADEDDGAVTEEVEVVAEVEEEKAEEPVLVTASADSNISPIATGANNLAPVRLSRTPPTPAPERVAQPTKANEDKGVALVAAASYAAVVEGPLDPMSLAKLNRDVAMELGPLAHIDPPGKYRTEGPHGAVVWDGPRTKTAKAEFPYPEERTLSGAEDDYEKILAVMPETTTVWGRKGGHGGEALVASGGLCAPLTPFYGQVNFATEAEPVWDALPAFRAVRGGVNVPESTFIGDITTAISSISEADDALGGTFATKSCQDMTCPEYTETAVQILAHCREYGNLNARAWPEKIAHENALTMAALSRTSETFLLDRIKALSVNVTNGVETLGALIYLVDAIVKARFGIIGRFRMPRNTRFRALIPYWVPQLLVLDTIQTQFDRFRSEEELVAYLRSVGIDPVFYLDSPSTGTTQLPDTSQTAAAIDPLPDNVQWALYPEGAFLGIDMGTLELGIVRDSTLNSTNDFQVFGERFRNVARIAPQQATYWVTSDLCASGQFPPAGTARTCD